MFDAQGFFVKVQELLVVTRAPAIALRVVPVVVAALTHQPHLEVIGCQFVAFAVSHQQLEFCRTVAIGLITVEQGAQPRQPIRWPYRLHQTPGNRASARLLQAGLQYQLQRRFGLRPFALHLKAQLAIGVEGAFFQVEVLAQLLFGDRAKLVTGQGFYCITQRSDIQLARQAITRCWGAVQVAAIDVEISVVGRVERRVAALDFQRQTLWQEILYLEFIHLRFAVAEVEDQLPAPGRRFTRELQLILIERCRISFPDELAADLFIRSTHFDANRLRLHVLAVTVTQQAVEQHGFAGAIQIARAEDEELQRVGFRPRDIEFGQVQRRAVQAQQAGLFTLMRQQHFGLGWQWQLGVSGVIGLALADHATIGVIQFKLDTAQGLATLQRLGEHVQSILITVHRQTNVAQGEQGRRLGIVVSARSTHDRQIDARLLQRLEAGNRQQQGFPCIARRVQVEAAAIDQIGHGQQVFGFITLQDAATAPLAEKRRQGFGLDAEEFNIDLGDVQRDHRQTFGQPGRQQTATAGETDGGLQITGFQTTDVFRCQLGLVHPEQTGIQGQDQFALRLKMAQTQLHQIVGEFPSAVDLAGFGVHQVQLFSEFLLRVQRYGKAHGQGAGTLDLDFRDIDHCQLTARIALAQGRKIQCRFGLARLNDRCGRIGCGGRRSLV